VPALPAGLAYVEVAGGGINAAALRSDGSIVVWGSNVHGQTNVPTLPLGVGYVQVAAGWGHIAALRSDGTVVAWGDDFWGQTNVPPLPPGVRYVQVAAGDRHTVALRSDGAVVAWGSDFFGQTSVPAPPPGLGYVKVAAGGWHTVARAAPSLPSPPAAQTTSYGIGCAALGGAPPVLAANGLPSLGNTGFALNVTAAPSGEPAWLLAALATAASPFAIGGGCALYLDLESLTALVNAGLVPLGPVLTGPAGQATFALPIAPNPALSGLTLHTQAALTGASGLSLTNALQLIIH